jgi:DNA helicase IV
VPGTVKQEQDFTDYAYDLLTDLNTYLAKRMESIQNAQSTGTGQDDLEREAHSDNLRSQIISAEAARNRLYFGRIDSDDKDVHRIGRIGLRTPDGDMALIDWRAPNAAPFYQATTAHRMNTTLRRRISTKLIDGHNVVTHVDDEWLTEPGEGSYQAAQDSVAAPRDGRMADILATIAADQDTIIRSPLNQVTVVQGGPGTGKTVVALHRAAWLLYTHRERLAKDAILIIGPSAAFLRYIDQVLPSLGETDIVLLTPGQLFPGISATTEDSVQVSAIKGHASMAQVIERAVMLWPRVPDTDISIQTEGGTVIKLTRGQIRESRKSLNKRANYHSNRENFLKRLLDHMARNIAHSQGDEQPDQETKADLILDFIDDRNVRRVLNLMWMPTTAEKVITKLLSDSNFLAQCADGLLSPTAQSLLLREQDSPWTVDDVPLLDECADLLGEWLRPKARSQESNEYRELNTADMHIGHRDTSGYSGATVAERAYLDREWVYGHIVVDEAQELSEMAWRAVSRRSVRKSLTIVGDLQQSSHPAGARTWEAALDWAKDKVVINTLNVTYRITAETVSTASRELIEAGGVAPELVSIRNGEPTSEVSLHTDDFVDYILTNTQDLDGRACVIAPDSTFAEWRAILENTSNPDFGFGALALDSKIAVLSARETKGLEFDTVFVLDPHRIRAQGVRGSDIFVACTRATHRLHLMKPQ